KELGQRIIVGAQVGVGTQGSTVVILAKDGRGYAHLCRLLSRGHARGEKGDARVTLDELLAAAPGLVALCPEPHLLSRLREGFGRDLYALVARHRTDAEIPFETVLRREAMRLGVLPVAAVEVLYHQRERRPLQDVLSCLRNHVTLDTAGRTLRPNAEHEILSSAAMAQLFADEPLWLRRSVEIAEQCTYSLDEIHYRYPSERLPEGRTEYEWLRDLVYRGALTRYGEELPAAVRTQIERELELIFELEYVGYFLTMFEVVEFCKAEGILCQGRGSAANSVVCYCLGITAIDPIQMELLFERFLSRERAEPPDIDLDIEHERREEVIQHVYARYGRRHAAMAANVICYRSRLALREVGKVFGIPQTEIDGVARLLSHWTGPSEELLRTAGLDPEVPAYRSWLSLAGEIQGFPRHLSIHPGGFVLGHLPVDSFVPIEPATMENRTVIQWDKQDLEDIGLFKVDLLGLGALTAIHRAFDLLSEHKGIDLEMATVPIEDPKTYEMICAGDTIGVFQIESRAQMAMLPRLLPRTFYDLVIQVAIVRPGPIQGDMVHPYLKRRAGKEAVDYPHPRLQKVLGKTYGVPIFQEQVMRLAMEVGGYSGGEADQLRRDMAAWKSRGRIERHRDVLVSRMVENGVPQDFAERVFCQIEGFGEYGFPESHAASFAFLAYLTAWLRCHHPEVFTCAMLNAQPMGFYSPSTLVEDAKRHGVTVLPIDVQRSAWDCSLESRGTPTATPAVRMGHRYVKGLGTRERDRLAAFPPPYRSLEDFVLKTRLSERHLVALGEAGAYDGFGIPRREALWEVRALSKQTSDTMPLAERSRGIRFRDLSAPEEVSWDHHRTEHSTRGHPMAHLRPWLRGQGVPTAQEINALRDGARAKYVGVVICRQRPGTATGVTFFTLEDETGFVNLVVWADVFARHAFIGKTASLLGVHGRIQFADNVTHLIADRLFVPEPPVSKGALVEPSSRDFH
ncbi:MAG: error-prone DNA polymerase, partial [Myxococcales bacterium]|nr:error-prone DNA polymerase [Myxococcales bacterium]